MFGADLYAAMEKARAALPPFDLTIQENFLANMVFSHQTMIASERLLATGATLAEGPVAAYYKAHLAEERNHAFWLEEDLASAGVVVDRKPLSLLAAAMVGTQYYLMYHVDQTALLGYMAALEAFPTPLRVVAELEDLYGPALLRTVRHHAEHDDGHFHAMMDLADDLPRSSQAIIQQNALQTIYYQGVASRTLQEASNG